MHNFKVGDKVERKAHHNNDIFLHYVGPAPYVVTAVSTDGYFLCINNWEDSGGDRYPWSRSNFTLVAEQDDPLPPAPESVRYNEGAVGFTFEVKSLGGNNLFPHRIRLGILCGDCDITHKYVCVDPDTALQLAYDLRRMAMEIRRKEHNR